MPVSKCVCATRGVSRRKLLSSAAHLVVGAGLARYARAAQQPWPLAYPITVIVPGGPGSFTDQMARMLTRFIETSTGQKMVVEPRPGASGLLAAGAVAHAKPNGQTLLYTAANLATFPATMAKPPFDPVTTFTPIGEVLVGPLMVIANPKIGPKSMVDLLSIAKRKPDSITYGHWGIGSPGYIVMETVAKDRGIKFANVPYKSIPQSIFDLIAGLIPVAIVDASSGLANAKAGNVVPLAVTGAKRLNALPAVPSFAELRLNSELLGWQGLFGPAGLTPELTVKLNSVFAAAVANPEIASFMEASGSIPVRPSPSPQQWAEKFKADVVLWKKTTEAIGLQKN